MPQFRFSLRTLMVISVTVPCLAWAAWEGWHAYREYQNEQWIREVERIQREDGPDPGPVLLHERFPNLMSEDEYLKMQREKRTPESGEEEQNIDDTLSVAPSIE
jgi:hypothetical protein